MSDSTPDVTGYANQLHATNARFRHSLKKTKAELAALKAANDDLTRKLTEATNAAKAPHEKDAELAELRDQLRAVNHRHAFESAARGKIDEAALADAWTLSGYKPESDEVDPAKLGGIIDTLIASKPYLAKQAETAIDSTTTTNPLPVPGKGKGAPAPGSMVIKSTDYFDPSKTSNPKWVENVCKAQEEGRLVVQD